MKKLVLLILATLATTGLLPMTTAFADDSSDEASFVAGINSLRANKGLDALTVDAGLTGKARIWAQTMADKNMIWHSVLSDGNIADWQRLGENVGRGGSVVGLETAFVNSLHHYENLVDPSFGSIGLGVVRSAGGVIFVAEEFMQLRTSSVAPAPPAVVKAPIAAKIPKAVVAVTVKAPAVVKATEKVQAPVTMAARRFAPVGRWISEL